jgi:hypothetical protein
VSEAVGALDATRRRLREVEEEVGELRQVFFSLLALLVQKYELYTTNTHPSAERGGGGGGGAAAGIISRLLALLVHKYTY